MWGFWGNNLHGRGQHYDSSHQPVSHSDNFLAQRKAACHCNSTPARIHTWIRLLLAQNVWSRFQLPGYWLGIRLSVVQPGMAALILLLTRCLLFLSNGRRIPAGVLNCWMHVRNLAKELQERGGKESEEMIKNKLDGFKFDSKRKAFLSPSGSWLTVPACTDTKGGMPKLRGGGVHYIGTITSTGH